METQPAISEALDLAQLFVKMLRAVPVGHWGESPRVLLIDRLKPAAPTLEPLLDLCRADTADWNAVIHRFEHEFTQDPSLAGKLWEAVDWPRPFWLVLRDEMKQIAIRRSDPAPDAVDRAADIYHFVAQKELVGLAFSGGGIRSATFNLGILQGLAEFGFLPRIDILSTVSGGGYAGAWFAAWMKRLKATPAEIQQLLSPKESPNPGAPDQKPIRFLRQFSNYLTPALGVFSFDIWTMAAVYLRNVILNQLTLVAAFGALLILPRLAGVLIDAYSRNQGREDLTGIASAALAFILSVYFIARNLGSVTGEGGANAQKPGSPGQIQALCIWPLLLAIFAASELVWKYSDASFFQSLTDPNFFLPAFAFFALLSLIVSLLGGFWKCFRARLAGNSVPEFLVVLILTTALSAGVGVCLLRAYILLMQFFHEQTDSGLWHATVWGPPALLAVMAIAAIVQVGLMGIDFPDSGREWLSRFRAVTNLYTFFWLALFCAAIYGPWLIAKMGVWASGLGVAWIGTTITAVMAGKSAHTGESTGQSKEGAPAPSKLDYIAKIGPPVFLVGFVLVISLGVHLLLAQPKLIGGYSFDTLLAQHWDILNWPINNPTALWNGGDWFIAAPVTLFLLLAAVALILAWRVDINEFSMHHFYKNRLVRCYLGASNPNRNPNPFTGFDDKDDLRITELKPSAAADGYKGPYHIINTTLNLSAGGQLAWQERQATSFVFTPCYSGFNLQDDTDHPGDETAEDNLKYCAYRNSNNYAYRDGIHLGTAVSISGAAADPNQGYNTSPAVAFLMTVFDVRLGWWLGNPRRDKESRLSSPRFGLAALVSDLFGQTDDRTNFVSLSDGGHFDNMGIYELVRRRCKYIVLGDGEQDSAYTFGGLGMAIRKCRIDFGAEIDIDPKRIIPLETGHRSDAHCAVGKIKYADGKTGVLVYIKNSLTGDEPEDVLQYAAGSRDFPHETTADQWFSESQFESYRKLGYHAVSETFLPARKWVDWDRNLTPKSKLFDALTDYWYPLNPSLRQHATKHTKTLNDLLDTIRASDKLHQLGSQLFPGGGFQAKPADPVEEFFFCMTLIQLVEDIYFDFGLDRDQWHADPRIGGWMDLFNTWKNVPQVVKTWNAEKKTFRDDFQLFWEGLTPRARREYAARPAAHP